MTKGRLEAFSDGVIAIIITIMVLELHPPEGVGLENALVAPIVAMLITVGVVVMWLVPDRRMERVIRSDRPQA